MIHEPIKMQLTDAPWEKDIWREACKTTFQLDCKFRGDRSVESRANTWSLGALNITSATLSNVGFLPVLNALTSHIYIKIVTSGVMLVEQDGVRKRLGPGDAVLVDPDQPYEQVFDEKTELIALQIPKETLRERGLRFRLRHIFVANMASPDTRAIIDIITRIANQHGASSVKMRMRQGEYLADLVDLLLDDPTLITKGRSGPATLFQAKCYIEKNFDNPGLTRSDIAAAVHVSDSYLNRIFREQEGQSIMRFLLNYRLAVAENFFKQENSYRTPIGTVASNCGFATHAHFTRTFKQRYGMSPRELMDATALANRVQDGRFERYTY
ncbi:AraC family transcriptional regulator [Paraburkholderia solisilvae]|uniref:HTH-type transcriptional activator RhaR n=1 Tax=Paraburkholderia solisilvae TaxID=624376 RepID=A0A6J5EX12_9BURK|nr:AraC family transcriptional regulator [Paraburkholderia solisilvae]CAB3771139.1 HTH-type transcriptional activator RhaR [Paraburkholderia solisilvae]